MPDDTAQYRLGRAIRRVRRYQDLTQEQLADRAGMHARHIGDIERGVKDVRWSTVVRLAEALGVPISTIIDAYEGR